MSSPLEFLSPTDKPALLALSSPEFVGAASTALADLGYKIHIALNHGDFITRFLRVQYQVLILEELFDASNLAGNLTLENLQAMPMSQRRHAITILIGDDFQTLNPMQAFGLSVHGVINRQDLDKLSPVIQQVVADNTLFLNVYRDATIRVAQGKA